MRVLVAEDNAINQKVIIRLLEKLGCAATLADDGVAALEAFESGYFDVVLLDYQMPRMDGLEVARSLRARGEGPRPLLVAMTGFGQAEDRARTAAAGFDHHLTKPVDPKVLQSLMQTARSARA